jgi:hypothetical protein
MDCFKNFVTKFINEATESELDKLGFNDKNSANVFYYIGRYIENKGPQTEGSIKKYLDTKFNNEIPEVTVTKKDGHHIDSWEGFLSQYFYKDGRKWDFTADGHDWWEDVAKWHDSNAESEDPNAYYVKMFWDWYRNEKKAKPDNYRNPSNELMEFIDNSTDEELQKAFGKYYKFAMSQLQEYFGDNLGLTEEDKLIQKFWDWHRAKKAGKPYQLDQDTIDGLVTFLRKPKAVEVLQQYYYYFVRVIEKLSDKNIKTPINTTGLQKELQRIMDNLENDDFVDELEKIERNRLRGGDMTAGPVFILPTEVIKSIRSLAKDTNNINKEKVGKIDKSQVKDCYAYCVNELNRKFHVGKTGIFDLNIQDFYDTYKIVFQRGFNTKTLHKIFDEVSQYLLDQLDKGTADYWKNRGKIEQDEIDDFNEAYKTLKAAGYVIVEDTIDDVLQHGLSTFDKDKLEKGKKPSWAAKVTEIGPRPKRLAGSRDWTERAWRAVRGEKEPDRESYWRKANKVNLTEYQNLEKRLKALLNVSAEFEATKDKLKVYMSDKRFEIENRGFTYSVKKFGNNSVFDRKSATVKSLAEVAKFIEENV